MALTVVGVCYCWISCATAQSTYCNNMHEFCAASGRMTYVVNLDPAADHFEYPVAFGECPLLSHRVSARMHAYLLHRALAYRHRAFRV